MAADFDVVVVGAGVVGLSLARRLAIQGARVLVLDQHHPGGHGSRAAAGVAIPSVRLLGDPVMLAFVQRGQAVLEAQLEALEGGNELRRGGGILRLVPDGRMREQLEEAARQAPDWLGTFVPGKELAALEPALEGTPLLGAYHSAGGFMVDTAAYLQALQRAVAGAGAEVRLGTPVRAVEEHAQGVVVHVDGEPLRADQVVVAAGAWSGGLGNLPRLPVTPLRGQMLILSHPALKLGRILSGPTYLAPWRAGEVAVGATEEHAGFSVQCTTAGLLQLLAGAARVAPLLREAAFVQSWAGLRSSTPDGRPLVGRWPGTQRIWVGSGHGGQGILTGALTGELLGELLAGEAAELARPFSPTRSFDAAPRSPGA
jgi:glycine oxidase